MAEKNTANIGFEKQIWDAACVLWGHIPASEYRNVIIGLIFLKYISTAFDKKYQQLVAEGDGFEDDPDAYLEDNVFFVPEDARWDKIAAAAHKPEIGTVIDDAMRAIEADNKKLKNVLPKNYASHDSKRIPLSSRERAELDKIYPYYGATSVMDYVDRYLFDGIYLLLGEDGTVVDGQGFPILQYVEGKFWVNNHAHIITGKNGFTVELLYLLFSLTNVQSIVTGAVQPKISQANLNKVPIVIPSEAELKAFDESIQPFFAEIRNLRAENDRLATVRDTPCAS